MTYKSILSKLKNISSKSPNSIPSPLPRKSNETDEILKLLSKEGTKNYDKLSFHANSYIFKKILSSLFFYQSLDDVRDEDVFIN